MLVIHNSNFLPLRLHEISQFLEWAIRTEQKFRDIRQSFLTRFPEGVPLPSVVKDRIAASNPRLATASDPLDASAMRYFMGIISDRGTLQSLAVDHVLLLLHILTYDWDSSSASSDLSDSNTAWVKLLLQVPSERCEIRELSDVYSAWTQTIHADANTPAHFKCCELVDFKWAAAHAWFCVLHPLAVTNLLRSYQVRNVRSVRILAVTHWLWEHDGLVHNDAPDAAGSQRVFLRTEEDPHEVYVRKVQHSLGLDEKFRKEVMTMNAFKEKLKDKQLNPPEPIFETHMVQCGSNLRCCDPGAAYRSVLESFWHLEHVKQHPFSVLDHIAPHPDKDDQHGVRGSVFVVRISHFSDKMEQQFERNLTSFTREDQNRYAGALTKLPTEYVGWSDSVTYEAMVSPLDCGMSTAFL